MGYTEKQTMKKVARPAQSWYDENWEKYIKGEAI